MNFWFFLRKKFIFDIITSKELFWSLIINIIVLFTVLIKLKEGIKTIPLSFNTIYGIEYVGSSWMMLYLPLTGFLLIALNAFVARMLINTDGVLARFVYASTIVLQIFLSLAAGSIIWINS